MEGEEMVEKGHKQRGPSSLLSSLPASLVEKRTMLRWELGSTGETDTASEQPTVSVEQECGPLLLRKLTGCGGFLPSMADMTKEVECGVRE